MENIKHFLETSTIHGLTFVYLSKLKIVKVFWICVVCLGFIGAGVMIYQSFQSWNESPVKTSIETLSITDITYPKIAVCPPKNTYTSLNYDLMVNEDKSLDNNTNKELVDSAFELLNDIRHEKIMAN